MQRVRSLFDGTVMESVRDPLAEAGRERAPDNEASELQETDQVPDDEAQE